MSWAAAIGAAAGIGTSALSSYFDWKHAKEVMKNRHQWEVSDLRKAGLNPILSAGGGGTAGNAPITQSPDVAGSSAKAVQASLGKAQNELIQAQIDQAHSAKNLADRQAEKESSMDAYYGALYHNVAAQTVGARLDNDAKSAYVNWIQNNPQVYNAQQTLAPFAGIVNSAAGLGRLAK